MSAASTSIALAGPRQVVRDYVALTKPKVQSLLLLTTVTTMLIAGDPPIELILITLIGGYLSAGGRGRGQPLVRPRHRPADAAHRRPARAERARGAGRGAGLRPRPGRPLDRRPVDRGEPAGAGLSFAGFLGYTLVYTMWLKRRTPQNIVIGGAAGAVPPLVGLGGHDRVAQRHRGLPVRDRLLLDAAALLGTVAAHEGRVRPRRRADAPRVRGEAETRRQILLYSVLLYGVTQLPFSGGGFGLIYLVASLVLNAMFIAGAVRLYRRPERRNALRLYLFSLLYLALLFGSMVLDVRL
jgi:protoheme IX farnesyltransferase